MTTRQDLRLWYDQPATEFTQGLPLGNGRLGATVFGQPDEERIVLNESSLWSGSRQDADRPDAHQHLPEIRRMLLAGKNVEAQQLVMQTFTCKGPGSGGGSGKDVAFGCYQTLGDLKIRFLSDTNESPADYVRDLDVSEAVASVTYVRGGVTFARECFVSAPDEVIVLRIGAGKPACVSFDADLDRLERFETEPAANNELLMTGQLDNGVDGKGLRYAARLRADANGGTVTTDTAGLHVRDADEVVLLLSAATDFQGFAGRNTPDPLAATANDLQQAAARSFRELRGKHVTDYQQFFGRVSLSLDSAEIEDVPTSRRLTATDPEPQLLPLYFNYGRYLLISSSRPGGLPANLQGLWADSIQTPWNGDWHLDINVQMNYWPAEVCGLSELHRPLLKLIESLQAPGQKTATSYYNARGWVAHVVTNLWGFTSPGENASWGATTGGSSWLCQHLWEHYAFTLDEDYLRWAYPILKGSAEFYADMLVEEPSHSWLVTAPSNSPENAFVLPDGQHAYVCMGPTIDMQQLRELFGNCIASANILGLDAALRDELAAKRERLAPNQVGPDGRLQEWLEPYGEADPHHRHVSHMYGLHPYGEITPEDTPELAAAARCSLETRGDAGTGWSLAWKANFWARLQDGNRAHKLLVDLLNPTGEMGFDYEGGGAGSYANLFCAHPPFQIDGNFGGTAAVAELLLQSRWGQPAHVLLLPALPDAWPTGTVRGLRARGAITVDIEWNDGNLVRATLLADRDGPVRVTYRGKTLTPNLRHSCETVLQDKDFQGA